MSWVSIRSEIRMSKQMATIENSYTVSLEKITLSLEGKLNLSQKTEGAFINDFSENYKNNFDLQDRKSVV